MQAECITGTQAEGSSFSPPEFRSHHAAHYYRPRWIQYRQPSCSVVKTYLLRSAFPSLLIQLPIQSLLSNRISLRPLDPLCLGAQSTNRYTYGWPKTCSCVADTISSNSSSIGPRKLRKQTLAEERQRSHQLLDPTRRYHISHLTALFQATVARALRKPPAQRQILKRRRCYPQLLGYVRGNRSGLYAISPTNRPWPAAICPPPSPPRLLHTPDRSSHHPILCAT